MNKELENILSKVGELYNKYGIKSVTMDDVARELGMSKKTLYQYVENKNDLVGKVLNYHLEKNGRAYESLKEKNLNAIEELLEIGTHIIKSLKDYNTSTEYDLKKYYPELYSKLNKIRKDRKYNATINNLRKGKAEGLYRSDIDEDIIAKIQTSQFLNMASDEFFDLNDFFNPKNILELFIYHIRGITNKKGIEALEKTLQKIDIKEYLQ